MVLDPHLMTLEENKAEPPTMTPKEAIYAEVLAVISGGKEGVPADGGNLMHFQTKRALAFPNSQAAIQDQISILGSKVIC